MRSESEMLDEIRNFSLEYAVKLGILEQLKKIQRQLEEWEAGEVLPSALVIREINTDCTKLINELKEM